MWEEQFRKINKVNYVLLSKAPLWGEKKKYIYNPKTPLSQFFYKSDLEIVTDKILNNKEDFLKELNEIGFVILDLSPFPLNVKDTSINYRSIKKSDYTELVEKAALFYLTHKLNNLIKKSNIQTTFLFRYARVKNLFQNTMKNLLMENGFKLSENGISDIAQMGGGIDRQKLKNIMTQANNT